MSIYGYARVSTNKQIIGRQITNIKAKYPDAIIFEDAYTGTKLDRPNFSKLLKIVKKGDTIIFDSVSRMSRDASEGVKLYNKLMENGVELEFIKEPQINTATYKNAMQNRTELQMTGDIIDCILKGINEYMKRLTERQIELAFESAQREVDELHQRTAEGVANAKANGKQVGIATGTKLTTKKSIAAKEIILKHSKSFNGTLSDDECIKLTGISRNSFYKYKKELAEDETEYHPINIDDLFND